MIELKAVSKGPLVGNREVADYLGRPISWLYHEAAAQKIPRYKVGNQWRYRLSEIDEWLEARQVSA